MTDEIGVLKRELELERSLSYLHDVATSRIRPETIRLCRHASVVVDEQLIDAVHNVTKQGIKTIPDGREQRELLSYVVAAIG